MVTHTPSAQIDLERQKLAKEYARLRHRLLVVDLFLGGVYLLAWLVFGWSAALRNELSQVVTNPWLLVPLFALVFGGIYLVLALPLSYYSGFVLPRRYDQLHQPLTGWIADQLKGLAIGGLIGLVVLEVIYLVLRLFPNTWWVWASAFLLFFSIVMGILAPVILFPIFNKFTPLGDEHADLVERLTRLGERAGTNVRGVYKFDMSRRTKAANAAVTGLGRTRRIILGDTLIQEFTPEEIETVLAHELGHHVHKDIPVGIVVETISTVAGLWLAAQGLKWGAAYFGLEGPADIAALPLFLLVMGAYGLLTMPLTNAYSRWREHRADQYALQATGNGPAFASALARLANQNLADADPEPWVEWLLYSHPALSKRIARARAASNPPA